MTMRQIVPDEKASYVSVDLPASMGSGILRFERHGRMVSVAIYTEVPSSAKGTYRAEPGIIPAGYRPWADRHYFAVASTDTSGYLLNSTAYLYLQSDGTVGIQSYGEKVVGTVVYIAAP